MVKKMNQIIINNLAQHGANILASQCEVLTEKVEAISIMLEDINSQLKKMIKKEGKNGEEKPTENDRT
jgi:hypothetical protein